MVWYISGSDKLTSMNQEIEAKLDSIMADNDYIIICDSDSGDELIQEYIAEREYKNVEVRFLRDDSEYEVWPRCNKGEWKYKYYLNNKRYSFDPIIQCNTAREVDKALFIWDGVDVIQYTKILILLVNGKGCEVYFENEETIRSISEIDELRGYVTIDPVKNEGFNNYERFSIRELKNLALLPDEFCDAVGLDDDRILSKTELKKEICYAEQSLSVKEKYLKVLSDADDIYDAIKSVAFSWIDEGSKSTESLRCKIMGRIEDSFIHAYSEIVEANKYLKMANGINRDCILYLHEIYRSDKYCFTCTPIGMYTDIQLALYYAEWAEAAKAVPACRVELWTAESLIKPWVDYNHEYNYYVKNGEICWFEEMCNFMLIDEFDPFEPITYTDKNSNYMNVKALRGD